MTRLNSNTTGATRGLRSLALAGVLAAAGLASPALGQSVSRSITYDNDSDNRTVELTERDGNTRYVVTLKDGDVTIEVNGQKIPKERYRLTGDVVQLLDESGRVDRIFSISAGNTPGQIEIVRSQDGFEVQRPPVMLGVTLTDPGDTLREQLGLAEGSGIVVNSVMKGLPASESGLKRADVIVAIDGKRNVDQAHLRGVLRNKQPGERMELIVLRQGREAEIVVKLEKFDPERLGTSSPAMPLPPGSPPPAPAPRFPGATTIDGPGGISMWLGEDREDTVRAALEQAMEAIRSVELELPEQLRGELDKAREELDRAIEQMEEGKSGALRFLAEGQNNQGINQWRGFVLDNDRLIRVPGVRSEQAEREAIARARVAEEQLRAQLDEQRARVERTERRLDEFDARLQRFESMMDRFERLLDRMEERN
jgi:hypothetical protein